MGVPNKPDHIEVGLAMLESQFDDSPNLRGLIRACLRFLQDIEDMIFETWADRLLETAAGAQLDQYGDVLGAPRNGLGDVAYRRILRVQILANLSSGSIDRLLQIWKALEATDEVDADEYDPRTVIYSAVRATVSSATERARTKGMMLSAKKGGIEVQLIEATDGYFGFKDDPDAEGFGEGEFAEVL